jgi:hypothetical protein
VVAEEYPDERVTVTRAELIGLVDEVLRSRGLAKEFFGENNDG